VVIADEIAKLRPDFVGLEQAAILRTGTAPPATAVTFDMLQSFLQELAARGVRYETVAVRPGLDAEVPTALGFDVRLTMRDALIVRADLLEEGHVKLSNLQIRQYIAASTDTEGYSSIDVTWRGRQFRFVATHFALLSLAVPEALELVQTAANTTLPVLKLLRGDFEEACRRRAADAHADRTLGLDIADIVSRYLIIKAPTKRCIITE
jgi:hypothetical protein